jgi:hypothetical protein
MWVEADSYDVTMLQPYIEKKYISRPNDYDLIEKVECEINGVTGNANAKGMVKEVL